MNLITKELFLFNDNGIYSAFTSGILSTVFEGKTYKPAAISRSSLKQSDNNLKNSLSIDISLKEPFAYNLIGGLPETPLLVTLYRNGATYWQGKVLGVKANKKSVTLECSSIFNSRQRAGVFACVSLTCRHTLYGEFCGLAQASFRTTVPDVYIDSSRLYIPGLVQDTDYFTSGVAAINGQQRYIKKHVKGATPYVDFSRPFTGVLAGSLDLYPGCDLQETTCLNKFDNVLNFGGFSRLPTKNPFGSGGLL